jgi:hypothetical protein
MRAAFASIVLLLAVSSLFAPLAGAEVLGYPFCDSLRHPESKAACLDYINASSSIIRWTSAVRWAKYYKGSCKYCPAHAAAAHALNLNPWQSHTWFITAIPVVLKPEQQPHAACTTDLTLLSGPVLCSADTCANVTALCLLTDMHAEKFGSTCTVAASNTPCEMDTGGRGSCWNGMCVGERT